MQNYKDLLRNVSKSPLIGSERLSLKECESTSKIAEEMLKTGKAREGLFVSADHQTAGRGQAGNTWVSGKGQDITCSIVVKPAFLDIHDQFYLNIVSSLAVKDLLSGFLVKEVSVKWPNDVMAGSQKISGILVKNYIQGKSIEASVIGIGINVNQLELQFSGATSMAIEAEKKFDIEKITDFLIRVVDNRYSQLRQRLYDDLLREYLSALYWKDELHSFLSDREFSGIIRGIDEIGRLQVEEDGVERYYAIKEIQYVR